MTGLTIGKAAAAAGVRIATIRFYERSGLIAQPRKPETGYRIYSPGTVARVRFIRQAKEIGFSLTEIAELLALQAEPGTACGDVRGRAQAKRAEVTRKIDELVRIRDALDALIAACPGHGALRSCSILNTLNDADRGVAASCSSERKGSTDA